MLESYTFKCLPENSAAVPALQVTIAVADAVPAVPSEENSDPSLLDSLIGQASSNVVSKRDGSHEKKETKTKTATDKQRVSDSKREKRPKRASKPAASATRATTDVKQPAPAEATYVVDGLWPGEIYQFVVAASNCCGLGEFSRVSDYVKMESTAPDAPCKPTVTNVDKRQADVEWVKPRCNGSEILQYTLFWNQSETLTDLDDATSANGIEDERQSTVLLAHSIAGTRFTLTGLLPGRSLRVWVSATNLIDNAICTSPLSPVSATERTLCDVPDAPRPAPRLASASSHSLALVWTPPVDNGLRVERYDVVLYHEEAQFGVAVKRMLRELAVLPADCHAPDSQDEEVSFTIEGLRGGCFYSADLRAVNALGAGPASDCSAPVSTLPATAPASIPSPPHVADVTPTSATLAWSPPANDGGAPMTSYQVQLASYSAPSSSSQGLEVEYQSDEEDQVDEKSLFDGGTGWAASCLRPRRVYRFRVAARNAVGTAAFSPWSRPVVTPSLVEFTVSTYFANRPEIEHAKARVLQVGVSPGCRLCASSVRLEMRTLTLRSPCKQRRYRAWKVALAERKRVAAGLARVLQDWIL